MPSTLIKNGLVYDGTGAPPKRTDVLVQRSRIARLGDFGRREADRVIDATGASVMPGIIEIGFEPESASELLAEEAERYFIRHGVTTVMDGVGGSSLAPLIEPLEGANHDWRTLGEFWRTLDRRRPMLNFGTLIGYAALRRAFTRGRGRDIDERELGQLVSIIRQAFKDGALGIALGDVESAGVSEWELMALAGEAARAERVLSLHLGGGSERFSETFAKVLTAAKKSGASIELSHFEPVERAAAEFKAALGALEKQAARANVNFDICPVPAARLPLRDLLPSWFPSVSPKETVADLRSARAKDRLLTHFKKLALGDLRIAEVPRHLRSLQGKRLGDIAQNWGTRPERALLRLAIITELKAKIIEPAVDRELWKTEAADGRSLFTLNANETEGDLNACFHSLKDALPLEQMVAKLTSWPAKKFGLARRGIIAADNFADIVILRDNKVQTVFVNGAPVLENGIFAAQRGGGAVRAEK